MSETPRQAYVWDIPTRFFHWALLLLVGFQWASAKIGGFLMDYHMLSGYAILALILFRLLWGFVGSHHSRFATFLRGVPATLGYLKAMRSGTAERHLGHNPLGGWMIVALLGFVAALGVTGLFANDDVMTEGPLMQLVSKEASDLLTSIHHLGFKLLLGLVALHVVAIYAHLLFKRENLVRPMITGRKDGSPEQGGKIASPLLAATLLAMCGAAVAALVKFAA